MTWGRDTEWPSHKDAQELTDLQMNFVVAFVALGGGKGVGTKAAKQAGYKGNYNVLRNTANQNLHNQKILAAIRHECRRMDEQDIAMAQSQLRSIMRNKKHPRQLDALTWFMGTLGISPVTKSEVKKTVEHTIDGSAIEKLKRLTGRMGIDPARLIDVTPAKVEE